MNNRIVFFSIGQDALIGVAGGALWGAGTTLAKKLRKPGEITWGTVGSEAVDNAVGGDISGAGVGLGLAALKRMKRV